MVEADNKSGRKISHGAGSTKLNARLVGEIQWNRLNFILIAWLLKLAAT